MKALQIDETLAEAHTTLGFVAALYEYDWAGAETSFRRALELNPNHAFSHLLFAAVALAPRRRFEETLQHQRRACELDSLSAVTTAALGTCLVMMRQYDDAISACRRALELDLAYPWSYRSLCEAYLLKGLYREAEQAFSRIEGPVFAAGYLGYCYARTHREPQARELLLDLERRTSHTPMLAFQVAVLHLGLGEADLALDWLGKACDACAMGIHRLKIEPIWDPLRSDPRFPALLNRLRLSD